MSSCVIKKLIISLLKIIVIGHQKCLGYAHNKCNLKYKFKMDTV